MDGPLVFISYSHQDEAWKDRLERYLAPLVKVGRLSVWDDRRIDGGSAWFDEITKAMDAARVAVCLITEHYLASDFCLKEEIPALLKRRRTNGILLIPILLRPCAWQQHAWLASIQMYPRDGKTVSTDFADSWDLVFSEVNDLILTKANDPGFEPVPSPVSQVAGPSSVDIDLPTTGMEVFGRQNELTLLDDALDAENVHVVSLVARGGVGKTTLVNKWIERIAFGNYRGLRRVYARSFYSQGTGERVTSADEFIAKALDWFGDRRPEEGSPWDKGERLAALVRAERTLLVLDGLEPLQSSLEYERGKINDPALAALITDLARNNSGLCLITTREPVVDLEELRDTTLQTDLEQISTRAGRALLRMGGVRGRDDELESVVREFGNHALALSLLAAYLYKIPGHPISRARDIPDSDIPLAKGRHPRRVLKVLTQTFVETVETDLLSMLGLFDRPADRDAIAALRAYPDIPGLTQAIHSLSESEWTRLLEKLVNDRLINRQSKHRPDLDAHPIVREHFGEQLLKENPTAWRLGNDRLYEHFKTVPTDLPQTLNEMVPLFLAVGHGCKAGRHEEVFRDVFWRRIRRGRAHHSVNHLGAWGADLAALSAFFEKPWSKPSPQLEATSRARVLQAAGVSLRALGRLPEAMEAIQAALETEREAQNWKDAAFHAGNLAAVLITMGRLAKAVDAADEMVTFATLSGDLSRCMVAHARRARALHRQGKLSESRRDFEQAEGFQERTAPDRPRLHSIHGAWFADLLIDLGHVPSALDRAAQTLQFAKEDSSPLDTGVAHFIIGRGLAVSSTEEDFTSRKFHLDESVAHLRGADRQDHLPYGLLARAAYHRARGTHDLAERDVAQALSLSMRTGMVLHEADARILQAWLALDGRDILAAQTAFGHAAKLVFRCGYGLRGSEIDRLRRALAEPAGV